MVGEVWFSALISLSSPLSLSFRSGYEQDVEFGNTVQLGDCHGEPLPFIPTHLFLALSLTITHHQSAQPTSNTLPVTPVTIPTHQSVTLPTWFYVQY